MSLSPMSFEILSDLLALRLESFLVTSTDEARELKLLRHCQQELTNLHAMGREMAHEMAALPAAAAPAPKISRRLQRLVNGLQDQARTG